MASDQMRRQVHANKIGVHVEAIGAGLLGAGLLLLAFLYLGAYLRGGFDGLIDTVNPFLPENYLPLLGIVPGVLLIWIGRKWFRR